MVSSDPVLTEGPQYHSPYFNETHVALREEVRQWMEEEIMPNVTEWDEAKKVPDEIFKQMGDRGYLAGLLGMKFPADLTDKRVKSVPPEKWDLFHEMLLTDELSRSGSGGFVWSMIGGYGIGAPPLFKFGKPELVKRIGPGILSGDKRICLAITEPGMYRYVPAQVMLLTPHRRWKRRRQLDMRGQTVRRWQALYRQR
jgi:alkylation response protein AidB-like acyl-CoA dehydrogenase